MNGIVAIIQARMGSTRLPGKVLRVLEGATVLRHVIERVRRCPEVDRIVVATTELRRDDAIVAEARAAGVGVARGSEDDVLSRYHQAARDAGARHVLRITSDCPLLDPSVVSAMLVKYLETPDTDYMSNFLVRRFPQGLDAEVMRWEVLDAAHREAREPHQREHVTPFIYEHPERFRLRAFTADRDLAHLRWTLDTEDDWSLIHTIYSELYPRDSRFGTDDVLALLERRPELSQINSHVKQKPLHASGR